MQQNKDPSSMPEDESPATQNKFKQNEIRFAERNAKRIHASKGATVHSSSASGSHKSMIQS